MKKTLLVARVADEYSIDDLIRFREQFVSIAQKCHQLRSRAVVLFFFTLMGMSPALIFLASIILSKDSEAIRQNLPEWIKAIVVGSIPVSIILYLFTSVFFIKLPLSRIKCPACNNSFISNRLRHFCPECGSNQIKTGSWVRWIKCNACGKWLSIGKGGRHYMIRVCTHCGVFLDEIGVGTIS